MDPFAPPLTSQCCLCGSTEALSGEHKLKAAALRSEFGAQPMVIGRPGERYRHAQSPSSKQFHFPLAYAGPAITRELSRLIWHLMHLGRWRQTC